jgi:hypothetical protein
MKGHTVLKLIPAGVAAMIATLAIGAAAGAAAPRTLRFTMTTVTEAQGMHVNVEAKIWVKGQKARAESNDPRTGPVLILVNGPQIRTLFPKQKRGMISTMSMGKNAPKNPWEFMVANVGQLTRGARKVGQESIDGHPCDVYLLTHNSPGSKMSIKSWIARDLQPRMPVKVENKVQVQRPNVTVNQMQTTRITGIQSGIPISDSLFTVPSGYKIVQAGGPGGPVLPGMRPSGRPGMGP